MQIFRFLIPHRLNKLFLNTRVKLQSRNNKYIAGFPSEISRANHTNCNCLLMELCCSSNKNFTGAVEEEGLAALDIDGSNHIIKAFIKDGG